MSNDKLDLILRKLGNIESELKQFKEETRNEFQSLSKKLESYHSENINADNHLIGLIQSFNKELVTHGHHFNVVDKQLVNHAIEIDKLKNR